MNREKIGYFAVASILLTIGCSESNPVPHRVASEQPQPAPVAAAQQPQYETRREQYERVARRLTPSERDVGDSIYAILERGDYWELTDNQLRFIVETPAREAFYERLLTLIESRNWTNGNWSAAWQPVMKVRELVSPEPYDCLAMALDSDYASRVFSAAKLLKSGRRLPDGAVARYRDTLPALSREVDRYIEQLNIDARSAAGLPRDEFDKLLSEIASGMASPIEIRASRSGRSAVIGLRVAPASLRMQETEYNDAHEFRRDGLFNFRFYAPDPSMVKNVVGEKDPAKARLEQMQNAIINQRAKILSQETVYAFENFPVRRVHYVYDESHHIITIMRNGGNFYVLDAYGPQSRGSDIQLLHDGMVGTAVLRFTP